ESNVMRLRSLFLAAALVALFPTQGWAQTRIMFNEKEPPICTGPGKVYALGNYALDATDTALKGITLFAHKVAEGGPGGQESCTIKTENKSWNTTITGLPAGTYSVFAQLEYDDKDRKTKYRYTGVKSVKVD